MLLSRNRELRTLGNCKRQRSGHPPRFHPGVTAVALFCFASDLGHVCSYLTILHHTVRLRIDPMIISGERPPTNKREKGISRGQVTSAERSVRRTRKEVGWLCTLTRSYAVMVRPFEKRTRARESFRWSRKSALPFSVLSASGLRRPNFSARAPDEEQQQRGHLSHIYARARTQSSHDTMLCFSSPRPTLHAINVMRAINA
jgi:hypothetical protein